MLAWIGNLLIVVGLWKIGDKWRHAFLFSIAGELLYVARSVANRDWALASICVVFCAMALVNWIKWGRPTGAVVVEPDGPRGPEGEYTEQAEWIHKTYTHPWNGANGGSAVIARLERHDGMIRTFVLCNPAVAKSLADAIYRVIGLRPALKVTDPGVTSGRQLMGPRPSRGCGGPPLCHDQHCELEDGH